MGFLVFQALPAVRWPPLLPTLKARASDSASGGTYAFSNSATDAYNNAVDTGLSRIAAGVVGVGNGIATSPTGTLVAGNLSVGSTTPWGLLSVAAQAPGSQSPLFVVASSTPSATTTALSSLPLIKSALGTARHGRPYLSQEELTRPLHQLSEMEPRQATVNGSATTTSFLAVSTASDQTTQAELSLGTFPGTGSSNYGIAISGGRGMIGYDVGLAQLVLGGGSSRAIGFYVNGTVNSFLSGTEAMFISGGNGHGISGDVGIGNTSPWGGCRSPAELTQLLLPLSAAAQIQVD